MPTLTRESRALLPLVLSAVLLAGGFHTLVFVVAGALAPALETLLPAPLFAVLLALLMTALSVALLLLARGAAREGRQDDAWHHVAVTSTWLSLVLVVMSVAALVGAMLSRWPNGTGF